MLLLLGQNTWPNSNKNHLEKGKVRHLLCECVSVPIQEIESSHVTCHMSGNLLIIRTLPSIECTCLVGFPPCFKVLEQEPYSGE